MKLESGNIGLVECTDESEIEIAVRESARMGMDEIWLFGEDDYPSLAILTNGDKACVHYFSGDHNYQSVGSESTDGVTAFIPGGEESMLSNCMVIPLKDAVACATAFYRSTSRPSCIDWEEI